MKPKRKKVLAISGSTRKNSSNSIILNAIAKRFEDSLEVEVFEGIDTLPHFNPDLDNENLPEIVQDFRDKIAQAEGVLICTPEYVFSLPGSLKNAIEWNVSTVLFSKKPVALIVAAASGEKAMESLALVMHTLESAIPEGSKLLIKGAKGKVNTNGSITDPDTSQQIDRLMGSFLKSLETAETAAANNQ